MSYIPLTVNFDIPELIQDDIDRFLEYLNDGKYSLEDCYRTEIDCDLKLFYDDIERKDIETLRDYYVRGGLYKQCGDPRPWKKK